MPAPSWSGAPERGTLVDEPLPSALTRWVRASGATSLTHMISSGALPSGVSLSQTGVLQGTPSSSGTFGFTVAATDTYGATREKQFTLKVLPTFQVGSASVSLPVGSPFTLTGPAVPTDADVSLSLEPAIEGVDVEVTGARALLRGTLSESGTFTSKLVARRSVGPDTIVVGQGDIVVDAGEAPVIAVTQPTGLRVGYPVDVVQDAAGRVPVAGPEGLDADDVTTSGVDVSGIVVTPTATGHTIAVTLAPGAIDGELVVEVREGATVDPWCATSLPGAARLRVTVTEAPTFAGVSLGVGLTSAGTAADPIRMPATGATSFGVAFAGRPAPSVTLVSVERAPSASDGRLPEGHHQGGGASSPE